jgi:hypothetical protein
VPHRPLENKAGWHVEAQRINRPAEKLGHFATLYLEANNWIAFQSTPSIPGILRRCTKIARDNQPKRYGRPKRVERKLLS